VAARPLFAPRFQDDGLPDAMRPDHGPPCATPACCGLRPLAGWWITLGLRPQRLAPGRPKPHGAPARLPRPRTAAATRPPAHHPAAPHARCDRCCRADHDARPHAALHDRAPAARSRPSPRALPAELPAPTSPGHDVGRRVSQAGTFRFQTRQLFISATLLQEDIALEETADGLWSISCSDVLLARLDARDFTRYVCNVS
jgi:putative transposase